jgi:hypothetical protein
MLLNLMNINNNNKFNNNNNNNNKRPLLLTLASLRTKNTL